MPLKRKRKSINRNKSVSLPNESQTLENEMSDDLSVDKYHLDTEWENYPDIYDKWGRRLADAIFDRDSAKDNLDLIRAELDADIRQSPSEFGIERLTESAIQAAITLELKYKQARIKLNRKQRAVNRLTSGLKAVSSKKTALENEVRLYLGNYFSEAVMADSDFQITIDNNRTEATRPQLPPKTKKKN